MAYDIVNEIITQFNNGSWKRVIKRKRFREEFDPNSEEGVNDWFKVGISFLGNEKIKLYDNFIESDLIIASPLGLRLVTGQDGEEENRREYDFLSSIQILILDQAHIFQYQNTEHLEEVLKSTNKVPKSLDILNDINRIKDIYLEKLGKHFRQSIVVQNFRSMDIDYIIKEYCSVNYRGSIWINKTYEKNLLQEYSRSKKIKITLRKLNTDSIELVDDTRFNFFTKKLWQKLYENLTGYTVVFCSTYFEFVRVRSFLKNNNANVAYISEYSSSSDWMRNRAYFENGSKKFILITERALFFQMVKIRYARNIIFYSLPECPKIFDELIGTNSEQGGNLMFKLRKNLRKKKKENTGEDQAEPTEDEERKLIFGESVIFGLFSIFDSLKMERLAGSDKFNGIINNKTKDTFQFI